MGRRISCTPYAISWKTHHSFHLSISYSGFHCLSQTCVGLMPLNQFNHDKMWKCIDSITINRYNLNISINSIMLLSTYESTQSTHKNNSNDSIKSLNQLNMLLPFFGRPSISLTFLAFFDNWIDSIIPFAQSKSIQSSTLWKRIDSITNQLIGKGTESIPSILRKNKSIQISQLNRVDWYTSLQLNAETGLHTHFC